MKLKHFVSAAAVALTLTAAGVASAATVNVTADLKGSTEVPPNQSTATGKMTGTLDTSTRELKYHVDYKGLSGPATAAHFHGPAEPGANAKPQVPISKSALASPIKGQTTLTAAQEKDLTDGKWYFNVHTTEHPDGEIRGQLEVTH